MISGNQNSSNEDIDEVEDKMPDLPAKKVRESSMSIRDERDFDVEKNRYNQ